MRARAWAALALGLQALGVMTQARAYDIDTHRDLGTLGLAASKVDTVLKRQLGVAEGVQATFGSQSAAMLLSDGAGREDIPVIRVLNHFHDPLRPWDSAGLRLGLLEGNSSVVWGQRPDQDPARLRGGTWSWPLARQRFLGALTARTPDERERRYAETFRSLGQLMHLVQDSAVPAHVRNDPHPPFVNADPYEGWVEDYREKQRLLFLETAGLGERPDASLLTPEGWTGEVAPVTRLIDSDTYLGYEPGLLNPGKGLGLGEFTNGNFISRDTRFSREYRYPRLEGVDIAESFFRDEGTWLRRYFPRKLGEGVPVRHFVAEGLLYEAIMRIFGRPLPAGFVLTRIVHSDYARHLLPRAVGYSGALLDHFFRGRLDVDVADDPARPGSLRVIGSNGSGEVLGAGGLLTVYSDDETGQRGRVGGTRLEWDVPPGIAMPPVVLDALAIDASTRLVAVYQGPLGAEGVSSGSGSPGAVAGKVFRPVGVEEVFTDGTRWMVRTAAGTFPLPLPAGEFEQVRWVDDPDMLIARTPFGPGRPSRMVVYRLRRDPTGRLPFLLGEGGAIQALAPEVHEFPFDLPSGTAVRFRHVVDYRQQLTRVQQRVRQRYVEGTGHYEVLDIDFVGPDIETTVDSPGMTFETGFGLVLDTGHHASRGPAGYAWDLVDVTVDTEGRPLAVVVITLTEPPVAAHTEPIYAVDSTGRTVITDKVATIVPRYPDGLPAIWLLVDLANARVVASTAEPLIDIDLFESRVDGPERVAGMLGFYERRHLIFVDGPAAGSEQVWPWLLSAFRTDTPPAEQTTDVEVLGGFTAIKVTGALRAELRLALAAAGFTDHVLEFTAVVTDHVYGCRQLAPLGGCRAIRIMGQGGQLARLPASLDMLQRPRPGANDRLLVVASDYPSVGPARGALLLWEPGRAAAEVRHRPGGVSPADSWDLAAATGSTALLTSSTFARWPDGPPSQSSVLVSLDGSAPPVVFPDTDLGRAFVLLDPDRLYHTRDLKFYRSAPPLTPTALPARLADAVAHAPGDFHAVRLP